MAFAFTIDLGDGPAPLSYGPFRDADDVGHSSQVLDLWTDEELAEIGVVRTEAVLAAPTEASRLGFRLALAQADLLEDVEAAVSGSDLATRIYWADAATFHRDNVVLLAIAGDTLDPPLSGEQLDDLFTAAAALGA